MLAFVRLIGLHLIIMGFIEDMRREDEVVLQRLSRFTDIIEFYDGASLEPWLTDADLEVLEAWKMSCSPEVAFSTPQEAVFFWKGEQVIDNQHPVIVASIPGHEAYPGTRGSLEVARWTGRALATHCFKEFNNPLRHIVQAAEEADAHDVKRVVFELATKLPTSHIVQPVPQAHSLK